MQTHSFGALSVLPKTVRHCYVWEAESIDKSANIQMSTHCRNLCIDSEMLFVNMIRLGLARLRIQQVCFGWDSDDHCHDHSPPASGHLQIMWTKYLQAPSPKVQYSEKAIVNSACVKKTCSTRSCFMYSLILCAFCVSAQLLQVKMGQCWILTETLCGDPLLLLLLE